MKIKLGCVGYTTQIREDWEQFAPEITPPSNYKDKAKIAKYVEDARMKQLNTADTTPLLCEFREVCAVNEKGECVELMTGTRMAYLGQFTHIAVIGASLMRHLLMREQIEHGRKLDAGQLWNIMSLRTGYPFLAGGSTGKDIFDPVHALTCTSTLDDHLDSVAKAYGYKHGTLTATDRAVFAYHLCKLMGIADG